VSAFDQLASKLSEDTLSIVFPILNLLKTFTTERIKHTQLFFIGTNNGSSYSINVNNSLESLSTSDLTELFNILRIRDYGKDLIMDDDGSITPVLSEI
jgi:hypothetical protein